MIKTKKQMFIIIGIFALILLLGGTTYAWFTYSGSTNENKIISGDVYLDVTEGNETLTLTNIFPETKERARSKNNNYITFTVSGLNESEKDIYYEIILNHGDDKPSPKTRYNDADLVFDLVELDSNGNEVSYVVDAKSFDSLIEKRIWVDTISKNNNTEVSKRYKLRAWLSKDVIISDTEQNANYTTTDFPNKYATIQVSIYGDMTYKDTPGIYSTLKRAAISDVAIQYGYPSSSTNGEGLYRLRGTENNVFPIVYYRGNINNNNVLFAGFCWQMVRTTETGGVKMIYNGVATGNGTTCENTLYDDRIIGDAEFNSNSNSPADVGYMYNKRYVSKNVAATTGAYYGASAEYGDFDNNGTSEYRLVSTSQELNSAHHYSCDLASATGTCTTIRYYYYLRNNSPFYIELEDGEFIEDALYKMTGTATSEVKARTINQGYTLNVTDSKIKTIIESWFQTNLTNELDSTKTDYRKYIEDTVYCNDRSFDTENTYYAVFSTTGWNPNNGNLVELLYYGAANTMNNNRWYSANNAPVLTCPNETDRFTVSSSVAHLNYPVGLLLVDEYVLAGMAGKSTNGDNSNFYLYTGSTSNTAAWVMSPRHYNDWYALGIVVRDFFDYGKVDVPYGIRPVISLKMGVEFTSTGDGTPTNPYVVKY